MPEAEVSKAAIDKLITIARREFDQVIVDVGSRIDVAAKALFENASTVYLVSQTGISELRNSNRLISQFFSDEGRSLEIVINRFDSHFHETMNEGVVDKALGRPVRWKIPNDQNAARTLQAGDNGRAETRVSRISVEMASSITGLLVPEGNKGDVRPGDHGRSAWTDSQKNEVQGTKGMPSDNERTTPSITWPTPDPITYGDKLTFAQLNAEASVEGTFVYTPGPSYVLPAGTAHAMGDIFAGRHAELSSAAGLHFNRRGQGNADSFVAESRRNHLRRQVSGLTTQCLVGGGGEIRVFACAGRSAAAGIAYTLGRFYTC